MSVVTLNIAGYSYKIACQDGQEGHIQELAKFLDEKAKKLTSSVAYIQENQLLAMVCILVAQELFACKNGNAVKTQASIDSSQIEMIENLSSKISELATILKKN
ncbi:MAG: cell division protein ZapA [Alphaproteobacteria bacterium]|nr:cell division protein ZapA [Alphaproteobacteria bacterium]